MFTKKNKIHPVIEPSKTLEKTIKYNNFHKPIVWIGQFFSSGKLHLMN